MSTIQVDRIIPYQSSSVTIEGDVTVLGAATTGSNTFTGDQNIQGTITASIQEGFALVGGVGNISTLVATSSFGEALPSGVVSGSQQITEFGFATTGSNTFTGDQIVSQEIYLTGSAQLNVFNGAGGNISFWSGSTKESNVGIELVSTPEGGMRVQGKSSSTSFIDFADSTGFTFMNSPLIMLGNKNLSVQSGSASATLGFQTLTYVRTSATSSVYGVNLASVRNNNGYTTVLVSDYGLELQSEGQRYVNFNIDNDNYGNSGWAGAGIAVANNNYTDYPVVIGFQSGPADYTDGTVTVLKPLDVSGSVSITEVMELAQKDPLPAGGVGQLAVSASNLYYHNGTSWSQIN